MKISRILAIQILKYCAKNKNFYFPFMIMCKGYATEDDDFVEINPEEYDIIEEDEKYQIFEIWENLNHLYEETLRLLLKGFIDKIINATLEGEIKILLKKYQKCYKIGLIESEDIEKYGENEFFGGKKEAYEEILNLINQYQSTT